MKTNNHRELLGYHGPYLERGGVHGQELVETLVQPPELPLSDEERTEAYAFAKEMFDHEILEGKSLESILRSQQDEGNIAPLFFPQAFLEGEVEFPDHIDTIVPTFESSKDVYAWLAECVKNGSLTSNELNKLAKKSGEYYREKMADILVAGESIPPGLENMQAIVVEPVGFIESATDIAEARKYLLGLRQDYKEGGDRLEGAKRALIDVYLARVNNDVLTTISIADYLRAQSVLIGDEDTAEASRLVIPYGFRASIENEETRASVFQRLDFLRNGIGFDNEGKSSAVDTTVMDAGQSPDLSAEQVLPFVKQLKEIMVDPEDIQEIMVAILKSAGKLSDEPASTWKAGRGERANDQLFQVVKNKRPSFAVNGRDGVYKVPSEKRSLYDVLIVGGYHELAHIDQAETDKIIGELIPLALLKGKRLSVLRESGADVRQKAAEQEIFGISKPTSLSYAYALRSLENNEGVGAATKAFYEEKRRLSPDVSSRSLALEAADRVLRLVGQGGRNSTAMSYAEGGVFVAELEVSRPEVKKRAGAIASLDLVDQARLHRYGLLPAVEGNDTDWSPHINAVLSLYIDRILSRNR